MSYVKNLFKKTSQLNSFERAALFFNNPLLSEFDSAWQWWQLGTCLLHLESG